MITPTTEEISIGAFQSENMVSIFELEKICFTDPYPWWLLSELARKNPQTFLVAATRGKCIGYAIVDLWDDHYHLVSIAVHPEHRRSGVATALLNGLEKRLLSRGLIRLEVRKSNLAAIQFYEKHGFVKTEEIQGYYADGEDAFLMERAGGGLQNDIEPAKH